MTRTQPEQTTSGRAITREGGAGGDAALPLRIGDLAARTNVTVETLRYYEKRGLLPEPGRRQSGYREYPAGTVQLVHFIKRAQSLGFTLAEVEDLVRLRGRAWMGDAPHRLREATVAKVRDIDERLRHLKALRSELTSLVAECDAACEGMTTATLDDPSDCPIVDALDTGNPRSRAAAKRRRN